MYCGVEWHLNLIFVCQNILAVREIRELIQGESKKGRRKIFKKSSHGEKRRKIKEEVSTFQIPNSGLIGL